jgi:hypothetical protein
MDDQRRSEMDSMVMQRRVANQTRHESARYPATGVAGRIALALAVLVLLVLLPGYAGTAGSSPVMAPEPLPAPATLLVTGPDFSEQT